MHLSSLFAGLPLLLTTASAQQEVGYLSNPSSLLPANTTLDFSQKTAFINGDLFELAVAPFANTTSGKLFIASIQDLLKAIHAKPAATQPLNIFTRIYFSTPYAPELSLGIGGACNPGTAPFTYSVTGLAIQNATEDTKKTEIYSGFPFRSGVDIDLQKTRYYGGYGNDLEGILRSQRVKNVVLSGLATAGVVASTMYRLLDLDYDLYIVSNNSLQSPPYGQAGSAILEYVAPSVNISVITVEQAIKAIG